MISFVKTWRLFGRNDSRDRWERLEVEKDDLAPLFSLTIKWWSSSSKGKEVDIELPDSEAKNLFLFLKEYFEPETDLKNGK